MVTGIHLISFSRSILVIMSLQYFVNVQKRNDGCCVILNPRYEDERSQNKETLHYVQCDEPDIHIIGSIQISNLTSQISNLFIHLRLKGFDLL
jgi:hypothetical protein